jgi:putative ABC transport system substrate-binding protein
VQNRLAALKARILMMKRTVLVTAAAFILLSSHPAKAQQSGKIVRLGFLSVAGRAGMAHQTESFLQGLREVGYVERKNIAIEYRWADGKFERLPELAAELVGLKVDVIVAVVTQASLAAKAATSTIPIVFVAVSDPVGAGLIACLARPGGNITGTSAMTAEIAGKPLGLLKEILPKMSRVAALWNPANPVFQAAQLREVDVTAKALGIKLQRLEASVPGEIERAFSEMIKERASAVQILGDPVFATHRKQIADLALKYRLPAASGVREFAEAGLLLSYGASFPESFRRAAAYVDKILKGAKPADIPVERPTKFEFVINLATAKKIGVTVSQSLLYRADEVIR